MRIRLDIDDDLLRAAKTLARREKHTVGSVISELTRRALTAPPHTARHVKTVRGSRRFPKRGAVVTNARIDQVREEDAF